MYVEEEDDDDDYDGMISCRQFNKMVMLMISHKDSW